MAYWNQQKTAQGPQDRLPKHLKGTQCIFSEHYTFSFLPGTLSRQMLIQWLHDMCESLNKPLVMSHQAQKGSDFGVSSWWSKFSHSFQVLFTGSHVFFGDMMGQVVDFVPEELALSWLKLQIMLSEMLKHYVQVM